jgi:hypothetical protein
MAKSKGHIVCVPKMLPRHLWVPAAKRATQVNPVNRPRAELLSLVQRDMVVTPEHLAVITTKYWGAAGVQLTVGFLDNPPADLRTRIIQHMNAWNERNSVNASFAETATDPQVRIARTPGDGYWSFLGTDILHIAPDQPTMNLESFTMNTPESEFHRVVRHETGHTLGFPHEHMRKELVDKIDPEKAYAYFLENDGWDKQTVEQQVLTPIEESSLMGTAHADPDSIMCYQIPGSITKDGQPIVGGLDIDDQDFAFAASIYPEPSAAPTSATPPARRAAHLSFEDFIEAASRASLRAVESQGPAPIPPGSTALPRPRIFIGIVAAEE